MTKLFSACAIGLCLLANGAYAQDAKAKSILDGVSKKVSSLKSLKANFSLTLTGGKGGKVTDSRKGNISLKGQKYHVQLAGQEIISDNHTVWTYNKDAKEVQVTNFNAEEQSISPAKLLTNFWDKEYKYSYKGERTEGGKKCDVIELQPTDAKKKLLKIELLVDKASSTIVGGNYWEKNGNKYQYTVSNFTSNPNIPDSYFTWDAKTHPGVETVDMR